MKKACCPAPGPRSSMRASATACRGFSIRNTCSTTRKSLKRPASRTRRRPGTNWPSRPRRSRTRDSGHPYRLELVAGGSCDLRLHDAGQRLWRHFLKDGKPAFQTGGGLDALNYMVNSYKSGLTNPNSKEFLEEDVRKVFQNGEAAFALNWTYMYNMANDPKDSKVAGKVGSCPRRVSPARAKCRPSTVRWASASRRQASIRTRPGSTSPS
jgi:hypothetical protein